MKTAVDKVGIGKARTVNIRFQAMCSHYLFETEFCNPASGWEKGVVEKNVQDRRRQIWREAAERRWSDLDALNAWLAERCRQSWDESAHPEWPALTVAEVWQDEQARLMPCPKPFDGYVEHQVRVSATSLIHFQRNRYSVPTRHVNDILSLRVYPQQLVLVADGIEVARHTRSFEREQTFYDWQHYIELVEIKPGALRNGAPFKTMPEALQTLQRHLLRHPAGRPRHDAGAARRARSRLGGRTGRRRDGAGSRPPQCRARAQRTGTPEGRRGRIGSDRGRAGAAPGAARGCAGL
jgi:hypothetical protein